MDWSKKLQDETRIIYVLEFGGSDITDYAV